MLDGFLLTAVWLALRLRMEMTSICVRYLGTYGINSRGQPTKCGSPVLGFAWGYQFLTAKHICFEMLQRASDLGGSFDNRTKLRKTDMEYLRGKLHNEEIHNLYNTPSLIGMLKSRRLSWAGHVGRMGRR
jgi:hypothetical protein